MEADLTYYVIRGLGNVDYRLVSRNGCCVHFSSRVCVGSGHVDAFIKMMKDLVYGLARTATLIDKEHTALLFVLMVIWLDNCEIYVGWVIEDKEELKGAAISSL